MKQNPYKQGMEAQAQGKPVSANPYAHGGMDWTRWRAGWHYQRQLRIEQLLKAVATEEEVSA